MRFHKFQTHHGDRYIDLDAITGLEVVQMGDRPETLIVAPGFSVLAHMPVDDVLALIQPPAKTPHTPAPWAPGRVTTLPADEAHSLGIAARRAELIKLVDWLNHEIAINGTADMLVRGYVQTRLRAFEQGEV